jgi:phage-related minor tail protein
MTTPGGPEGYTGQLDELFSRVQDEVQKIIDKFNAAVHHINDWKYVLGPALIWISDALKTIRAGLDKIVKLVQYAVEHHTPVVSLVIQSFNWQDHVQKDISAMVISVEKSADPNLAYWEGVAATEYRNRAKTQREAVEAIAGQGGKADAISAWLMKIAQLNVEFMTELVGIAADFLGEFVSAAIEAATVVEIPFAVNDLAGALGGLVTNAINRLADIANRLMETFSNIRDAKGMMNDSRLPNGQWPQAVDL